MAPCPFPPPNSMTSGPWAGSTLSPGVRSPRAIILIVLEGLRAERASKTAEGKWPAVQGAAPAAVRPPTFCLLHQHTPCAPSLAWHPTCRLQDTDWGSRASDANRDHRPP